MEKEEYIQKRWICEDANKRISYPNRNEYMCYTTTINGKLSLKNGVGKLIYEFIDEEEKEKKSQGMIDALIKLYQIKFDQSFLYEREHPNYYIKTYQEANWAHKSIYKGFIPLDKEYNPYHNFFGCSAYDPDKMLIRGSKKIIISFQGIGTRVDNFIMNKYKQIFDAMFVRYIGLFNNKETVFESWDGSVPKENIIESFFNY